MDFFIYFDAVREFGYEPNEQGELEYRKYLEYSPPRKTAIHVSDIELVQDIGDNLVQILTKQHRSFHVETTVTEILEHLLRGE